MTMRRATILAACLLALAGPMLGGCAVNQATGESVFTGLMSAEDEIRIGRQQHPQIVRAFGGEYGSPALKAYVSSVGQLLARTVERKEFPYKFTLLNSDVVNAFAIPGGYIYITRGLLSLAGDEAELAAVLGHELGHITAQHHAQRAGQELLANVLIAGAGIAAGQAAADVGNLVASALLPHYSREHEHQSDTLGVRYSSRAGYDPRAMADFLAKLRADTRLSAQIMGRSPEEADQLSYTASHPAPAERVQRASALAAQTPVRDPMRARDVYLKQIDGMIYGDDPEQGFIRGRSFAHPKMRVAFDVPEGFRLVNSAKAVAAFGPDKSRVIFDRASKPSDGPVSFYVSNVWAKGLDAGKVEAIRVNGLEGATATTRTRTSLGVMDVRLVAVRVDLQSIYRFTILTPPGQTERLSESLRRMTYSFRQLSEREAAALKPLRIRVVTARAGDTVASMAARLPFGSLREERFRVLNGLGPNEALRPGQAVKLVSD
jgi:predicted Zn-dependent protease